MRFVLLGPLMMEIGDYFNFLNLLHSQLGTGDLGSLPSRGSFAHGTEHLFLR